MSVQNANNPILHTIDGGIWVQKYPGGPTEYLGNCEEGEDIAMPIGDQTLIQCPNGDGTGWMTIDSTQAAPGNVTTTIKSFFFRDPQSIESLTNRYLSVYYLWRKGGIAGVFDNFERGIVLQRARFTGQTISSPIAREDRTIEMPLALTAWNPAYKPASIRVTRLNHSEPVAATAIASINIPRRTGDQQIPIEPGDEIAVALAAGAGAKAKMLRSVNGGDVISSVAAQPFANDDDIVCHIVFPLDGATWRHLVARAGLAANHCMVAYSDDNGVTWSNVTMGSIDTEGPVGPKSLFALDWQHIWLGTDAGNIYFSSDGGASWVALPGALATSGAKDIICIQFNDYDYGVATGASDLVMRTTDGGATWSTITCSGLSSDSVSALAVFSSDRFMIGSDADGLFQTWDGGDTWTSITFPGQIGTGKIGALAFSNHLIGFMIHTPASGQGYIYRTINGGASWKKCMDTPVNTGLTDIVTVNENLAYACGPISSTYGVILKVQS